MSQANKKTLTGSSLVLLAVLFVVSTVLVNILIRGVRLDLTDSNLYTLSEGTLNILASIEEPINLYFYFSDHATRDLPQLRAYATRVREVLEELAAHAGSRLNLQIIDPLPFTDAEDEASARGIQAIPIGRGGDNLFFGLVGTNALDGQEVIAAFDPSKENFLEYDLAKLIYTLNTAKRPVIGLMTSLPMSRGFDPATRQMREPWMVTQQIEQLFEVRSIAPSAAEIGDDVDVLMLVHPKDLGEETLFAIDQFVLAGGRLLLFLDPHAEMDQPQDQMDPQAAMFASRSSDVHGLLQAWGIEYDAGEVVLDREYGLQVSGPGGRPVRHIGILNFSTNAMNSDDIALAQLGSLNFSLSGFLRQAAGAEAEFVPLLFSSGDSMSVATDRVRFLPDPNALLDGFHPSGQAYVVAARLRGTLKSAFPNGLANAVTPPDTDAAADGEAEAEPSSSSTHLMASTAPADVVVVADTDLLADRLWVQVQSFFGQRLANAFANNGDFVINLLDNLSGSSDLISIRGRASARRPFTRVEQLEREADERFRATEQQLEQELQETERKLNELQAGRDDGNPGNPLILSAAQQTELERFRQQRLEVRKKLRDVQSNLRRDKESLGSRLHYINTFLVPTLLILVALAIWRMRVNKRRAS